MGHIRTLALAALAASKAYCQTDCSGHGVTWGQGIGPPPDGCGSGSSGGAPGGTATCTNPTCANPPCAAGLLGDVGCTTVSGTETYAHELVAAGGTIASNAHIYGPFEAGFTETQRNIIENWGCTDPTLVYDTEGGKDIGIAEGHVAHACNIELPRVVGNTYFGVVGPCGGHTGDYHFHRSFSCLYQESGGHSTKVGVVTGYNMYGKWEDYASKKLPLLDACGGHIGPTPDSATPVYHYHVQDKAPFTVGCHGPSSTGGLVSLSVCRSLYPSNCGSNADVVSVALKTGTVQYARFCPCFDASGSNIGTEELPALLTSEISYTEGTTSTASTTSSDSPDSTTTTAAEGTTSNTASTSSSGSADSTTAASGEGTTPSTVSTSSSDSADSTTTAPSSDQGTTQQSTSGALISSSVPNKVSWLLGFAGCMAAAPEVR